MFKAALYCIYIVVWMVAVVTLGVAARIGGCMERVCNKGVAWFYDHTEL